MACPEVGDDSQLRVLGIEQLRRGRYQPRRTFTAESLRELADSIRNQGVVQPIVVRPLHDGVFEILAGERRWRAAQEAGCREVPVIVRDVDDRTAALLAMTENVQREDLNPVEEAEGVARLVDELGLSHREIAEALGFKRERVSHLLRVARLEPPIKRLVAAGELSLGHAKVLAGLSKEFQISIATRAALKHWTVRRLEREVRAGNRSPDHNTGHDADIERLIRKVGETIGSPTSLDFCESSKNGTITFKFHSLDELDGILQRLGVRLD
ncbi:MAG: ParB/RepB/Spo0J family partition protein [Candidatus Thiodiazotropha sp.]